MKKLFILFATMATINAPTIPAWDAMKSTEFIREISDQRFVLAHIDNDQVYHCVSSDSGNDLLIYSQAKPIAETTVENDTLAIYRVATEKIFLPKNPNSSKEENFHQPVSVIIDYYVITKKIDGFFPFSKELFSKTHSPKFPQKLSVIFTPTEFVVNVSSHLGNQIQMENDAKWLKKVLEENSENCNWLKNGGFQISKHKKANL